jgi:RNA polymerase sigma-70 factor (ECF subfamily)
LEKNRKYDEGLLLERLAKGDTDAFSAIYDQFYPLIFYYTRRKVDDAEVANEITADCFIKFWKGGKKEFDSLEGIKAYLLRSANNACINAHRNRQTELAHQKDVVHYLQNDQISLSEEDEYRAALMTLVLEEIEKLPKQSRLIFKMAYFDEMKNDEIAEKLNLSNQTVRNQKNRAVNMLRTALFEKKVGICVLLFLSGLID